MFPVIIQDTDGSELIVEVHTYQIFFHFLVLITSIHAELIGLHLLMTKMRENVIVSHHFDEVILTPFIVFPCFLGHVDIVAVVYVIGMIMFISIVHFGFEGALVIRVMV